MGTFIVATKTVLPLFLVIFTGIIFSRTKVYSPVWVEVLNKYALFIGFPALVVASLMHLEIGGQPYAKLLVLNSGYILFCFVLVFPLAKAFRLTAVMRRSLFLILPFGNIAYLGIPVLQNTFGDGILPVAAIISAIYIFWMLTVGIVLIEIFGEKSLAPKKLLLNLIRNPLLLSVLVGVLIVLFEIKLPLVAGQTIQLFANSVTAVVLFSLGLFLGSQKLGNIKEWYSVIALVSFSMLLLPFMLFQALKLFNLDTEMLKASVIDAAMPLGLTPYALSIQYKLNSVLFARIVVLGTLLSVFIVPLWIVFMA